MDKKEILNMAQKNRNEGREYDNHMASRGTTLSCLTSLIVGIILFLVEYIAKGSINIGLLAVGLTTSCVQALYEGIKNKKVLLIIGGCVQIPMVLLFIIAFISQVVGK